MDQINTVELFSSVKVFNRLSGVLNKSDPRAANTIKIFCWEIYVIRMKSVQIVHDHLCISF
jgi:hypothetical protein